MGERDAAHAELGTCFSKGAAAPAIQNEGYPYIMPCRLTRPCVRGARDRRGGRHIGDGWCHGEEHNTAECGWDGGDCLVDGYTDCHVDDPADIGDGFCHVWGIYNTAECGWDGGDCLIDGYPDCHVADPSWFGDGECEGEEYNTPECGWDGGDCVEFNEQFNEQHPDCHVDDPDWIGDGFCDGGEYNTAECGWDGGDCIGTNKLTPPPGWPGHPGIVVSLQKTRVRSGGQDTTIPFDGNGANDLSTLVIGLAVSIASILAALM